MSTRRPTTQNEARIWNRLNRQDDFFPIISWPDQLIDIALNTDRGYRDRWFYLSFLLYNGLRPDLVRQWSSLGQVRWSRRYEEHINALLADYNQNRLVWPRRVWSMYDLEYKNI